MQAGAAALAVTLPATFAASAYVPIVRRSLSVSSKTAVIVMPAFFTFFLVSDQTLLECNRSITDAARLAKKAVP